jgi:uncharacterized protein DUF4365
LESKQTSKAKINFSMSLPDYVERRAEILAELFLRDLNPKFLAQATFQGAVWDYMTAFQTKKGRLVNIAVQVKATERPFDGVILFTVTARQAEQLTNTNIAVLIIVVDVKNNSIAWNWAQKAQITRHPRERNLVLIRLPLHLANANSIEKLRADIEAI